MDSRSKGGCTGVGQAIGFDRTDLSVRFDATFVRRLLTMKRFLWLTNIAVLMALLVAGSAMAQSTDPIKIGVILPMTGVYASGGEDGMASVKLAVEKIGGEIAGRPIQLIFEDGAANPQTTLDALERSEEHTSELQ